MYLIKNGDLCNVKVENSGKWNHLYAYILCDVFVEKRYIAIFFIVPSLPDSSL